MKTQLNKDQIQKLLDVGIDRCFASDKGYAVDELSFVGVVEYPVFKLEDIIRLLPKDFEDDRFLQMENWRETVWYVGYATSIGNGESEEIIQFGEKELIDALYQLLLWTIEQGWVEEHFITHPDYKKML